MDSVLKKRIYHKLYYYFLNMYDGECECGAKLSYYYSVYGKHKETRKHFRRMSQKENEIVNL